MQAALSVFWNLFLAFVIGAGGWIWLEGTIERVIATAFGVLYFAFASFYDELRRVRRKVARERIEAQRRKEVAQALAVAGAEPARRSAVQGQSD